MANLRKTYNYFIFDWDGTLAKTTEVLFEAYKKAFAKRGLVLRDEQIRDKVFGNWEQSIRDFAIPGSRSVFKEIVEDFNEKIRRPDLYEGVQQMLEKLYKRNKKIGLVTLTDRSILEPALKHHNIDKFFNYIVTGAESQEKKPDPRPLVMTQMGLNALYSETVFIGNSLNDVNMGRNAKLTTGIFAPKENRSFFDYTEITLAKPDFVFQDFEYIAKRFT